MWAWRFASCLMVQSLQLVHMLSLGIHATYHLSVVCWNKHPLCDTTFCSFADIWSTAVRCEDDLTHKLIEIVRANNNLRKYELNGAPQHILNEFSNLLQYHITTYFDNTIPGQPPAQQKSGRPIKSISQVGTTQGTLPSTIRTCFCCYRARATFVLCQQSLSYGTLAPAPVTWRVISKAAVNRVLLLTLF